MRGRVVAACLLVLYAVVLAYVLLVPDGNVPSSLIARAAEIARSAGAPEQLLVQYRFEFFANVMIVVPAAGLAAIAWPRRDWTFWTTYGFVGSLAVETIQAVLLTGRQATYVDVVANTLGALTGAVLVGLVRRLFAKGRVREGAQQSADARGPATSLTDPPTAES